MPARKRAIPSPLRPRVGAGLAGLTRELRARLDALENAVAEAQDLLSEVETAAGLVRRDGSRVDEPTAAERFGGRRRG